MVSVSTTIVAMSAQDEPSPPRPSWLIKYAKTLFVLCLVLIAASVALAALAAVDGAWGAVAAILAAGLLPSLAAQRLVRAADVSS
jgi:hypothetical protein